MIKDKMQLQGFPQMKMPKIKGHIKIELKDAKTGKKSLAYEGDNMVTNALRDIFASNFAGVLDYRRLLPLYSSMLGGVICFEDQLDDESADAADDYFIPDNSQNTVTAHAGQTTLVDQADDVTRGNPLSTAMSITDGAVTLAWEWGSTAGNGEISSVALTHSDVGDAGTGSTSNAFNAMTPCINAWNGVTATPYTSNLTYCVLFIGKDGYGYRFICSGQTVTIYKIVMPYEKTGLISNLYNDTGITTHTVSTTVSFSSQPSYFYDYDHDYLWLFYTTSARKVYWEKIRISDFTNLDHGNFDTDADVSLNADYPIVAPFDGTYVYLRNYTTGPAEMAHNGIGTLGFLKVNLASTADQSTTGNIRVFASGGVFVPNKPNRIIAGQGFVINNNVTYHTNISSPAQWYEYFRRTPVMQQRVGLTQLTQQIGSINEQKPYWNSVSKFYLATKFNLPTPIQKSNTQSMVVTYTLTEVEENE